MKCTVLREDIINAVLHAEKNTIKNHTLPVLSCVLLEVEQDLLTVTATNLEVGVKFSLHVSGDENGAIAVSGSVLSHVITSLPSGTNITLHTDKGFLHVTSSEGSSKLALQETEDFPVLPTVDDGISITFSSKKFFDAIQSVVYCASTSTIKPELSSVYVHPNGGTLISVATDSFRLAEKKITLQKPIEVEPFLIPVRSTVSLLRFLETIEKDVTVRTNKHQLSIENEDAYITLRLTAGSFPDYTQIIPKEFISEATILTHDFDRILKKATVFSDQYNQTTITISAKKKKFTAHTKNSSIGETTDTIPAAITGEDLTISFNQRYLHDAIHSITEDSITIQFAGQSQPAVIRPIQGGDFLYLVMPMNR